MKVTFYIAVTTEVPVIKPGILGQKILDISHTLTSEVGTVKAEVVQFLSTDVDLKGSKNVLATIE